MHALEQQRSRPLFLLEHSKSRELRVTARHHSSHDLGLSRAALQHLQKNHLRNTHTHTRLAHLPTQKAKKRHLAYLHIPYTHTHTPPFSSYPSPRNIPHSFNSTRRVHHPHDPNTQTQTNKYTFIKPAHVNYFHSLTSKHTHTQRFLFSLRHHINTYTRRTFSFPSFTFLHFILTHPSYQFACPLYHIHQMQISFDSIRSLDGSD